MSKLAVGIMMLAAGLAWGQPPSTPPEQGWTQIGTAEFAFSQPSPKDAHELAVQELKKAEQLRHEHAAHMVGEHYSKLVAGPSTGTVVYSVSVGGKQQSFSVDPDGKVTYTDITPEDALLMVIAQKERHDAELDLQWDREDEAAQEERRSQPPEFFKDGATTWTIGEYPEQWEKNTLATTYCGFDYIRLLEADGAKRDSLLHEVMHVATNCDNDPMLHKAIYQLAPGLLRLLQDNPELVRYLTKKPKPVTKPIQQPARKP